MDSKRVVVSVHGIRTFGQWQQRLARLLSARDGNLMTETYGYGYFSVLAFLFPPLRWLATLHFRKELVRIFNKYPDTQVDLVAHSFGTHLVGYGVRGLPQEYLNRTGTVLLAGSVLRSDFPWGELIDAGYVKRVVNDCGVDDAILILSQFLVLFTGMAGRVGFIGATNDRFTNRYFRGGHSHYFEENSGPQFMEARWLPVLLGGKPVVEPVDERGTGGFLHGVLLTGIQLADPLKLAMYVGVPALLWFFLHVQPIANAKAAAKVAEQISKAERTRADAESARAAAVETARGALASKLLAEEATSKAQAERAAALAAKAQAESERAAAESAAYQLLVQIGAQRQQTARAAWVDHAKVIASLPPNARAPAFNESLKLLDDALVFEFDRAVLTDPESLRLLDQLVERLNGAGIDSVVLLTGRVGKFCTSEGAEGPRLAPDTASVTTCRGGLTAAYAQHLSVRIAESVKAQLVSRGVPRNRIYTEGKGLRDTGFPYPSAGQAKAWNLVARQNNQVTIRLVSNRP